MSEATSASLGVCGAFDSCFEVERVALDALDSGHVKKRLEGKTLHPKASSGIPKWGELLSTRFSGYFHS